MTPAGRDVEAVLFDFGGVLSSSPFETFAHYEAATGLPDGFIRSVNAANHHDNAWARLERNELVMEAVVCSVDGREYVRQKATAAAEQAAQLGEHLAQQLIDSGARNILNEVNRSRG